jgi:hypothetical protein
MSPTCQSGRRILAKPAIMAVTTRLIGLAVLCGRSHLLCQPVVMSVLTRPDRRPDRHSL